MRKAKAAIAFLLLLILACGCSEEENLQATGPSTLTLAPIDTIGVFAGDSLTTFGAIGEVGFTPKGNIAVLDQTACLMRFYDNEGNYLRSLGGSGSAPGEFLSPESFAFLSDGRLVVSDWEAFTLWLFDESLSFAGDMGLFFPGTPSGIEPGIDGSFIGTGVWIETSESGIVGESFLGCWNDSTDEEVRYFSSPIQIVQDGERIHMEFNDFAYAIDGAGNVFVAESSDSVYCITGFRADGEQFLVIEEPWIRIPRSEKEMAYEEKYLGQEIPNEPSRFRLSIAELQTDGKDNIWVRLGSVLHPMFVVYSQEGDTLFFAECPALQDTMFNLQFSIGESAILAWDSNPLDYPKVIMLEVME